MTTSANVTYYKVRRGRQVILRDQQHHLCTDTITEKLAAIERPEECTVILRWPDEEEEDNYSIPMSLKDFLDGVEVEWEEY